MFRLPIIIGLSLSSNGFCCVCPNAGDAISASGAKTKATLRKNVVFIVLLLRFDQDLPPDSLPVIPQPPGDPEIGRASCRERVKFSVVAWSSKEKRYEL